MTTGPSLFMPLLSFFIVDPFMATLNERLAAVQAAQAVIEQVQACSSIVFWRRFLCHSSSLQIKWVDSRHGSQNLGASHAGLSERRLGQASGGAAYQSILRCSASITRSSVASSSSRGKLSAGRMRISNTPGRLMK